MPVKLIPTLLLLFLYLMPCHNAFANDKSGPISQVKPGEQTAADILKKARTLRLGGQYDEALGLLLLAEEKAAIREIKAQIFMEMALIRYLAKLTFFNYYIGQSLNLDNDVSPPASSPPDFIKAFQAIKGQHKKKPVTEPAPGQKTAKRVYPPAKSYRIIPSETKIKVDAVLDEAIWSQSAIIDLPFEWMPGDNIQAPVKTECMVTFTRSHLYIAFRCFDPDPTKIRAHLMDRDSIETFVQDDHISIMLDSFNDERRGFQFRVNPLGVQADANFSELEGYEDFSWDGIWDSAGKITDFGYIVEIGIPFNQLRFAKTEGEQTWGFDAERSYPRNVRHRMTSHVRARDRNCILCQFNKLTGFQGMSPGKNLEFSPTLTVNRTDERANFPIGKMENGKIDADPGISARWGITPNTMLNATINPDFSQVEADVAQLEVNTRFALRYPEKRPFFLEGADFFLTPMEAVFTRTIYNPLWGAKMTSKFGKTAVGIFATQDRFNNLLFPANQGSNSTSLEQNVYNGVLRFRRDVGRGSTIGAIYSGRVADNYYNHIGGVDGFFRLSRSKTINFQYLRSQSQYAKGIAKAYGQPENAFGGNAIHASFTHRSRNLMYFLTFRDLDDSFRADAGFIPRVDVREYEILFAPMVWGKRGGWFDRLMFPVMASYTTDHKGKMTDQMVLFGPTYLGPLQSNLAFRGIYSRTRFAGTIFETVSSFNTLSFQPRGGVRIQLNTIFGEAIDYSNIRKAQSLTLNPGIELGLGKHLNINLNHTFQRLSLKGDKIFTANLAQARMVYNFNIRTFVRAIVQYTDISRNTNLYSFAIAPSYQGLFTQFLFSYKINPQTVLFLGYSDNHMGFQGIDLTQANRTFFLKIGYALVY